MNPLSGGSVKRCPNCKFPIYSSSIEYKSTCIESGEELKEMLGPLLGEYEKQNFRQDKYPRYHCSKCDAVISEGSTPKTSHCEACGCALQHMDLKVEREWTCSYCQSSFDALSLKKLPEEMGFVTHKPVEPPNKYRHGFVQWFDSLDETKADIVENPHKYYEFTCGRCWFENGETIAITNVSSMIKEGITSHQKYDEGVYLGVSYSWIVEAEFSAKCDFCDCRVTSKVYLANKKVDGYGAPNPFNPPAAVKLLDEPTPSSKSLPQSKKPKKWWQI